MTNRTLIAISFLCASVAVPQAMAAETPPSRVAVINMQKAIKSVGDGKKAEETLRKEYEDRQKKLQAEGKKVQDAMENFRKQAMVMDEKSRAEKEAELQQQYLKLRELEARQGQEFQKRDEEISQPIVKKLRNVVTQLSKDKGYTLVIDSGNVIYGQDQDDITDEVIKRYDAKK